MSTLFGSAGVSMIPADRNRKRAGRDRVHAILRAHRAEA